MTALRDSLLRHGVPPSIIEAVLVDTKAARARRRNAPDAWAELRRKAAAARLNVTSNRPKRVGQPISALYEEYYELICEAIQRIDEARLLALDDGSPVTPKDIERKRAASNAKRAADGRQLLPECRADAWHTWIAPAARAALQEKVRQFYADAPRASRRGGTFTPFVLTADKQSLAAASNTLLTELAAHRALHKAPDAPDNGTAWGTTPYSALQLRMVAEAYKELRLYGEAVKDGTIDPLTDPLPKDWRMLLPADFRARMRAADDNPPATELTDYERSNFLLV